MEVIKKLRKLHANSAIKNRIRKEKSAYKMVNDVNATTVGAMPCTQADNATVARNIYFCKAMVTLTIYRTGFMESENVAMDACWKPSLPRIRQVRPLFFLQSHVENMPR